ncbi:helicase [Seminavis robusta]|uniref:Helicase n=1 Tax=Seminavis robusta TaxID=568900 RepID=A0A9N8E9V9_9STRA|nr:helicase [Seminavis robusta]|eukprot:Sro708_g190700.1 helicase (364) ;mRNA; f:17999-19090
MVGVPDHETWYAKLEKLKEFQKKHGHTNVHNQDRELKVWVSSQRVRYRRRQMPQERQDALNAIGFTWDALEEKWKANYMLLREFQERHGHCCVTFSKGLGKWCVLQREMYNKGRLRDDRFCLLDQLGFQWDTPSVNKKKPDVWYVKLEQLKEYGRQNGNFLVPSRHPELGRWVFKQKSQYKIGNLSQERQDALNAIGFTWNVLTEKWESMYSLLKDFQEKHGHCLVSTKQNTKLARWVQSQRDRLVEGKVSEERVQKLRRLGFVWDGTAVDYAYVSCDPQDVAPSSKRSTRSSSRRRVTRATKKARTARFAAEDSEEEDWDKDDEEEDSDEDDDDEEDWDEADEVIPPRKLRRISTRKRKARA